MSGPATTRRRRLLLTVLVAPLVAAVTACGGAGSATSDPQDSSTTNVTDSTGQSTAPPASISTPTSTQPTPAPAAGEPKHLTVPQLDIDASVVPVSARHQVLYPPSDPSLVGWWKDGVEPGSAQGTAILVAHAVHTGGGVFDNLDNLKRGDEFSVTTKNGTLNYVVHRVEVFHKKQLPKRAAKIFRQTGDSRLVLVSCDNWDGEVWESNVVVIASLTDQ